MSGTLIPWVMQQFLDDNGDPLASGTVDFYATGTTTRQNTYSDAALTTANANPVPLNSAGRPTSGAIYLDPSLAYKAIVKDSAGATVKSIDPVYPQGYAAGVCCQGRLTLTSGSPVSPDVTSGATLYFAPYQGNRISLYTGTAWSTLPFTEKSISLASLAAAKNYDVWGYLDVNGALALELLVWTSDTVRATALTTQDGVYVKTGDATRRYLGTIRSVAAGGSVTDSVLVRGVWNYYNRVRRSLRVLETTNSWTYTTATWRQVNGAAGNLVGVVVGVAESMAALRASAFFSNTSDCNASVGIGEDSTSSPAAECVGMAGFTIANKATSAQVSLDKAPAAGYHTYAWLEYSQAVGTTTWQGDTNASPVQTGITGSIDG